MIVVMDVGQSHARLRVLHRSGVAPRELPGFALNLALPGAGAAVADAIVASVRGCLSEDADAPEELRIGLSGYDVQTNGERARCVGEHVGRALGARRVFVSSDDVAWYRASLGKNAGVLAAVGTGTVVLGADGSGAWKRVDGAGYLLGDDGSGFDIGRAGLRSALRAADGRGGSAELLRRAERRYGSASSIGAAAFAASSPSSEVASFAREVAEAADAGDTDARDLWATAGEAVARSVTAAATIVPSAASPVSVSCQGALFKATELLWDAVRSRLAGEHREFHLLRDPCDPLDGAPDAVAVAQFPRLVARWEAA